MHFPHIDGISDKQIRGAVYNILNQIVGIVNRLIVHCIVTNHPPTSGKYTCQILNAANTANDLPCNAHGKILYLVDAYV